MGAGNKHLSSARAAHVLTTGSSFQTQEKKKVLNLVPTVAPEYNHLCMEIAPGPSLAIKIQMLRSVVKDGVICTYNLHIGHNRLLIIPNTM